jgi:glycosyltransferase involved in cell wall biosynthesis
MNIAILLLSGGIVERGAETAAYSLANIFGLLGHQVTVFQAGQEQRDPEKHFAVRQITLPAKPISHKKTSLLGKIFNRLHLDRRSLLTLVFSVKVLPYLARGNFDVIIPIDGFWEILLSKLLQLFKSFRIMVIGLAGIGWTDAQNLRLKPDVFIALTEPMQQWASSIQPKTRIVTIPLPINDQEFNASIAPAHLALKKPVVLTVAALTKYKRIDAVIRAVALLPEWSLLIIGQGEEQSNLTQLAQEVIPGRFQIIEVPHDSIASYYRASDVFVLASEPQEAFGMVLLEAQACGLPIVTTNDPSRHWILADSAMFVDPLDKEALAHGIVDASKLLSESAINQNRKRFSNEKIRRAYHALLNDLS